MKSPLHPGRRTIRWLLAGILAGVVGIVFWQRPTQPPPPPLVETHWTFDENDRILVLAPHPDDEVLGCGGVVQAALRQKKPVRIVYFTYGDNNEWAFLLYRRHPVLIPAAMRVMGEIRHREALAAGRLLGLSPGDQTFLGYPDFGTLAIWDRHWGTERPQRSMLTRVSRVPYSDAFRPGASYKGEDVLRDLETIFREFKPTRIFVSHPADHHSDHRALYLFTRVALWELAAEMQPRLYPYLVHFKGWPRPLKYLPDAELTPPAFFGDRIAWQSYGLSPAEVATKHRALEAHASEVKSTPSLRAFVRRNELFGDFSPIRLPLAATAPPAGERETFAEPSAEQTFLTAEEQAWFVGIEERRIGLENGNLVVQVRLSRPLARATELAIQAYGFRPDRPFGEMPKLFIQVGDWSVRVRDQRRLLAPSTVSIERNGREITARIPLAELGGPDRILTGVRTYWGSVPLDWAAWREIDLTR